MNQKLMNRTTGTLLVGAALGYVASLFLAPGTKTKHRLEVERKAEQLKTLLTDPEEQKRIKDIFEDNTEHAQDTYLDVKSQLIASLAGIRGTLQEIDKQKYLYTVDKVLTELKEKHELPKKHLERLKQYLTADFQKLKNNVRLD